MSSLYIPERAKHHAARLDNHVLFFGGYSKDDDEVHSWHKITLYDTITDTWEICYTEDGTFKCPSTTIGGCAVSIGSNVYTFGGNLFGPKYASMLADPNYKPCYNTVWKLYQLYTTGGTKRETWQDVKYSFAWIEMKIDNEKETPAPRSGHSGWEYESCMWIFGGLLASPLKDAKSDDYLNGFGEIGTLDLEAEDNSPALNSHLYCYDPKDGETGKWTSREYSGDCPWALTDHATVRIDDRVWLYGGRGPAGITLNDMYELDMKSLIWTKVQAVDLHPSATVNHTLNHLSDNRILLYGGYDTRKAWIFDMDTKEWTEYKSNPYRCRIGHTATTVKNSVIIIGGFDERMLYYTDIEIVGGSPYASAT